MKAESFFVGPKDEDITVNLTMSLVDLKYMHGILVDCYNQQPNARVSKQLENVIMFLDTEIKKTLIEEDKNS